MSGCDNTVEVTRRPKNNVIVTSPSRRDVLEVAAAGIAGPPNTLTVGTVEVGARDEAAVTITGVAPNQTINFVIPSASDYVHNQIASSSTWTITHNLGYYPSVTVVDSANNVVVGDVTYVSDNVVTVSFNATFGGKAYLS